MKPTHEIVKKFYEEMYGSNQVISAGDLCSAQHFYAQGLEDAAAVCERQSKALDHGGNTYIRDSSCARCADSIRALAKDQA